MSRRVLLVAAGLLAAAPAVRAQDPGGETTAFPFLTLGAGPRIEALAGAGTAVSEGADALHWNPALLAWTPSHQVAGTYFNWLDGVRSGYFGGIARWGRTGLGLSVRSTRVSDWSKYRREMRIARRYEGA